MTGRLLNRQARLLEYLTSGRAIFGGRRAGALDPALQGIDPGLLDLEGRFSHEKRMEKIAGVFPATFELLGTDLDGIVREFVDACPPHHIGRIDNARQFHGFLIERHRRQSGLPPYLSDIAACELACAEARLRADEKPLSEEHEPDAPRPAIRRNPGVVLLRTAFDIRSIFEGGSAKAPLEHETSLAIAWASGEPHILELAPEVFGVLAALSEWTRLGDLSGADELVTELAEAGLLELRH